jgi:hypothetical protein
MLNRQPLNTQQFLILAVGSAILLRLLLMPFFAHVDLFSEYRRVYYALDNDIFGNSQRVVAFYIETLFAAFSKLFIPLSDATFFLPDPTKSTASLQDYYLFLQDPHIYRFLFFFKLPYLLFDLGVAAIIWRFVDNLAYRKIALLLWLFNPLSIFAIYIFGRFEVFSIFFLALTAWQLKQHRLVLASICFAIALQCREINLLLTPFLLIALIDFKNSFTKNVLFVGFCTALIALLYLLPDWLFPKWGNVNLFVDPDQHHQVSQKLLSLGYYWFYPIIIGLSALAIFAWEIGSRAHDERFVLTAAIALLIYFAFNVHSVHYASWLVIFPLLSIQYHKKVVLPFLALFIIWIVMWLLKTDAGVFTPFLAAPLSFEFIGIGHFPSYFEKHIATESFSLYQTIQIMRSLFAVVMGFFIYRLVRREA